MAPSEPAPDLNALDSVRALLMLLGVFYHACYAYMPGIGPWYVVEDPSTSPVFTHLAAALHTFRMPVFFMLSGFFARLSLSRASRRSYFRSRLHRLAVPLLLAAVFLTVADKGLRVWAAQQGLLHPAYPGGDGWLLRPLHLWFLEYLLLFSAAVALVAPGPRLPHRRWSDVALLGAALVLALDPEPNPAYRWLPDAASVAYYGACFLAGYWHPFTAPSPRPAALSAGVFALACGWVAWGGLPASARAVATVLSVRSACAPLLYLGLRASRRWPALWRNLADASYTVYLVHHPLVVLLQLALAPVALPVAFKYGGVVAGALVGSVLFYGVAVRPTALRRYLGSRRPVPADFLQAAARQTM